MSEMYQNMYRRSRATETRRRILSACFRDLEKKRKAYRFLHTLKIVKQSLPSLRKRVMVNHSEIIEKATVYIEFMKQKSICRQREIEELRRQNSILARQLEASNLDMSSDEEETDDDFSSTSSSESDEINFE